MYEATRRIDANVTGLSLLDGLSVVQVGKTVIGASAAATLRLLGAEVMAVELAEDRDRLTEREAALCDALLESGKIQWTRFGRIDEAETALVTAATADLVIADESAFVTEKSGIDIESYMGIVDRVNRGVWVTVSPFGLTGLRKSWRGSELISLAAGGTCGYMLNSSDRPMKPAGYTASITAGQFAALAGLHGIRNFRVGTLPVHLDLSVQDTVVVSGVFLECAHILFDCKGKGGTGRYSAPKGVVRCRDGLMEIVVLEDHQWEKLKDVLGQPEWARAIRDRTERRARSAELQTRFEDWSSQRSVDECVELLQQAGVPATRVSSPADLLADVDLEAREFFVERQDGYKAPGLPAVVTVLDPTSTRTNQETSASVRKRRIVDLSHVLAGPLATSWLGAMDFDVAKIEDLDRLDSYRRGGPFMHGREDPEASAYFAASNFSKRSVALPLDSEEGRRKLVGLIGDADYVIENLSEARVAKLLTKDWWSHPSRGSVSSSGFGRERSSKAGWRAYGHNIHAQGGLIWLSRDREMQTRDLGTSWADPLTGLWIALLVSAQDVCRDPTIRHYDVSMVEVVAYQFSDFLLEAQRGHTDAEFESSLPGYAPHGVFRCAEDRWLALAVRSDVEWERIVQKLGSPEELKNFETLKDRAVRWAELEELLDRSMRKWNVEELAVALQSEGIAAAPVMRAEHLITDPHLEQRCLFQEVQHPRWGIRRLAGLPWRDVDRGLFAIRAAATIGEHTNEVLAEWMINDEKEEG